MVHVIKFHFWITQEVFLNAIITFAETQSLTIKIFAQKNAPLVRPISQIVFILSFYAAN